MLLLGIIKAVFGMLRGLIELFPNDEIDWPDGAAMAAFVGEYAGPLETIFPISELALTLEPTVEIVLPIVATARITLWFYFLTPFVK